MQSEQGFWKQATRPDVLEIEIASGKDLAIVWEEEGEILGFACAHDLGFRAYLGELIVAQPERHKGIGRQLVEHIEIELRNRGCPVLFSDVWRNAEGFYRRLGWSEPDVTLLSRKLAPDASQQLRPAGADKPRR